MKSKRSKNWRVSIIRHTVDKMVSRNLKILGFRVALRLHGMTKSILKLNYQNLDKKNLL
jgi:hypothetical protein